MGDPQTRFEYGDARVMHDMRAKHGERGASSVATILARDGGLDLCTCSRLRRGLCGKYCDKYRYDRFK